ncbi:hypothetical protein RSOLAG22IIIB_11241 [Rhizoctonia solani]|uniref:Uncharacterized protein n=1 Tax=Rhizoctonia solani TaxID=456999 RepID=A0A0K6G7P2_9AGAM|nr:hypothetical protein RSOLAG22IIIB_11241 [Rhizoctonia solani]
MPVLRDTGLILNALRRIPNVDPDYLNIRTSQLIDVAFDTFFDPTDIREGGILILVVSCHGFQGFDGNVFLQFRTQTGDTVDSGMLHAKIAALPKYCTLEVIMDTCCAESVIPGLQPISMMRPSAPYFTPARTLDVATARAPPLDLCLGAMVSELSRPAGAKPSVPFPAVGQPKYVSSSFEPGQPKYKASVVVWAASTALVIGVIASNGPGMSRRSVWENVLQVVEQHNNARRERDLRKPSEIQANLRNRTQRVVLLPSVEDQDRVLDGVIFQPIRV